MTPKGVWPRSRDLLLKQWDRYPCSTERISCYDIKSVLLWLCMKNLAVKLMFSRNIYVCVCVCVTVRLHQLTIQGNRQPVLIPQHIKRVRWNRLCGPDRPSSDSRSALVVRTWFSRGRVLSVLACITWTFCEWRPAASLTLRWCRSVPCRLRRLLSAKWPRCRTLLLKFNSTTSSLWF